MNLQNQKPYTHIQLLPSSAHNDQTEAIVYDNYRFEIVNLALATFQNSVKTHLPRSKSPLPSMPQLQKLL